MTVYVIALVENDGLLLGPFPPPFLGGCHGGEPPLLAIVY